jgi:hypothetical protein
LGFFSFGLVATTARVNLQQDVLHQLCLIDINTNGKQTQTLQQQQPKKKAPASQSDFK